MEDDDEIGIYGISIVLINVVFEEVSIEDTAYALGSICFVIFYLTFHLQSFFLSFFGVVLIIFSFTLT
jgi:hypothetical protein